MMAYHADVAFLEDCEPALIEYNATEFARVRDLLASVEPSVGKAEHGTVWESPSRAHYDARLAEVRDLVAGLSDSFDRARTALVRYADAVGLAQRYLADGLHAETTLDSLISQVATPVTRAAQLAEPMRRWEDIRETTGILDSIAEMGMDVDSIRAAAGRAYDQAYEAFGRARSIEETAREEFLAELRVAGTRLPDFRGGGDGGADLSEVVRSIGPLLAEAAQAGGNPLTRLAGSGEKSPVLTEAVGAVSPALLYIRGLLRTLPAGQSREPVLDLDGDHAYWIRDNKQLIEAAAKETGLPADLIAGIAWREVGGKPYIVDDITETVRHGAESEVSPITPENLPLRAGGERDATSYGPMAVQLRRAAEVLGYDPHNLSDQQRDEVRAALKDPAQNIFVASKYLANLKAESDFSAVPADQLTPAQYQELAARYNGGPHWQGEQAQGYGREVMALRHSASEALR